MNTQVKALRNHGTVDRPRGPAAWIDAAHQAMARIPDDPIALLGRFSIAAVFWKSGQTKVDGLAIDLVDGSPPELAANLAALAEHALPVLILLGLGTRFAALGLLAMTAVIQLLVYPGAYPTHGVWAAILLYLMARGPGRVSLDHWIARRLGR